MESIQTSSIQERALPIITFTGRPTDSKKGLLLFFDALETLSSLSMIENFIIWIIGGDDNETEYVQNQLQSYHLLKSKYKRGSIVIWGRVENDALPELFSRSSVLVMPSYREQFGMVAVEAMLCGCPVIGAKVGGLNDLILHQKTGFLFERGNSMSLCAVLSGFLRNKPERKKMRLRAIDWSNRFSQSETFSAITEVYNQNIENIPNFWKKTNEEKEVITVIEIAEKLINKKLNYIKILHSHGKHLSIRAITEHEIYFVKKVNEQASSTSSVFPIDFSNYPDPKSSEEQFMKELFQADNPYSPKIIKSDKKNHILINEYIEPIDYDFLGNSQLIINLIKNIRLHKPILGSESVLIEYFKLLDTFQQKKCLEQINEIDRIASIINERITKGLPTFTRFHPQVELYRLKIMISKKVWNLPASVESIFTKSINYLLENVEFNKDIPTLAHGDIKKEHFLCSESNILLCDWEHSKYCVGPLDEAKITFNIFHHYDKDIKYAIDFLNSLFPNNFFMLKQAITWFVSHVISVSIYWYTQGDNNYINKASDYLDGLISNVNKLSENKPMITP